MNKSKELREWANLILTIIGPALIALMVWSVNTKLDNQRLNIESKAAETYVSKTWYEADRADTNKRLDTISADISTIKTDIAKIQGRAEGRNNNNPR